MKLTMMTILALMTSAAQSQTTTDQIITLNPYLSFQHYEHFNRLTLSSPDSDVEFINGFEFDWGYVYTLDIKETKFLEPLSDGTSAEYALNNIISKTKVPDSTEFKLFLDPNLYPYTLPDLEQESNKTFTQLNDSTYLYMDEVEIEVPEHLKAAFRLITEENLAKMGWFTFIDEKRVKLIRLN